MRTCTKSAHAQKCTGEQKRTGAETHKRTGEQKHTEMHRRAEMQSMDNCKTWQCSVRTTEVESTTQAAKDNNFIHWIVFTAYRCEEQLAPTMEHDYHVQWSPGDGDYQKVGTCKDPRAARIDKHLREDPRASAHWQKPQRLKPQNKRERQRAERVWKFTGTDSGWNHGFICSSQVLLSIYSASIYTEYRFWFVGFFFWEDVLE